LRGGDFWLAGLCSKMHSAIDVENPLHLTLEASALLLAAGGWFELDRASQMVIASGAGVVYESVILPGREISTIKILL
jgi:hypothetical protein